MRGLYLMKKIGIFTYHNVKNAYACLFYLQKALQGSAEVDIWGLTSQQDISSDHYYSFLDTWYGKIPKVRAVLSKIYFLMKAKRYDVIIVNDLEFFVEGIIAKHIYKKKVLIHYNTELYNEKDYPTYRYLLEFYENHADEPDMIIDCLSERARYRSKKCGIKQPIYIIHNTIPDNVEDVDANVDIDKYLNFGNKLPIAIYAGGINDDRGLQFILKDILQLGEKVNFVFILYGDDTLIDKLKNQFANVGNCRIYRAVERKLLLNIMRYCSIGIQYYDPTMGVNQYYAAPSKFYEYVAMGLNVVSSDNEGINHVIEENELGICIHPDELFGDAVQRLLLKGLKPKNYIRQVFMNELCYEIDSQNALKKIQEFMNLLDTKK